MRSMTHQEKSSTSQNSNNKRNLMLRNSSTGTSITDVTDSQKDWDDFWYGTVPIMDALSDFSL